MVALPEAKLCIRGDMVSADNNRVYATLCPWTGEAIGSAADASMDNVSEAIAAAREAFDTTNWSTDHKSRYQMLESFRERIVASQDKLAEIAHLEAGAALGSIKTAHINGALFALDCLMKEFPKVQWQEDFGEMNMRGIRTQRWIIHEAVGVAAGITPWNVPLYVNLGKVFCALLAGCTMVLKPAPETPLMGSVLGELAIEAGLPPGVLNVITSSHPAMAGEFLTRDPRVDIVSFIGSTAVGKKVMENASATLKRVFLELGGKSAKIILDGAENFEQVVSKSMVVMHAGQGCATLSRLLVSRNRYAEACQILENAYTAYEDNWGDINHPDHVMGPVISQKQHDRIMEYIDIGQSEGARLLAGGKSRPDKGAGFFIQPTCFVDVTNDMRIAREEIFGPVLVVIPYSDVEDAISIANDSDYGLAGAVEGPVDQAMAIAKRIRAGTISVNGGLCIAGDLPFGGYKQSGIGREWGRAGIEEYLETKVIATGLV